MGASFKHPPIARALPLEMLQLLVVEGVDIGKVSLMVDPVLVAGNTKLVVE